MEILTNLFNVASMAWDSFSSSILYDGAKVVAGAVGAWVIRGQIERKKRKKERSAILNSDFKGRTASIIQLAYFDTKQKSKEVEGNIMLQWQQRMGRMDVELVFPDEFRATAYEYIGKAIEKCTRKEPLVFQHLKDVTPPKDYLKICDAIRNYWRLEFSRNISEGSEYPIFADVDLKAGYEPEKMRFIPALVYDPESAVKELRVLWFSDEQFKNARYINKRAVVIESPNELKINAKPNSDDNDLQWVDLYNNSLVQLRENPSVVNLSRVGILTGEIKAIPVLSL